METAGPDPRQVDSSASRPLTFSVRRSARFAVEIAVVAAIAIAGVAFAWPQLSPAAVPKGSGIPPPPSGGMPASPQPPTTNASHSPSNDTGPGTNGTNPGPGSLANLTLTLMPSAPIFPLGDPVAFALTITNIGSRNESVTFGGCNPWLDVRTTAGAAVFNSSAGMCPMIISYLVLAPGQSWVRNLSWAQQTSSGSPVLAGTYRLTEYWTAQTSVFLSAAATVEITSG